MGVIHCNLRQGDQRLSSAAIKSLQLRRSGDIQVRGLIALIVERLGEFLEILFQLLVLRLVVLKGIFVLLTLKPVERALTTALRIH